MPIELIRDFPDFLSVSPPRCATTWLHRCLSLTPGFQMPEPKELKYFSNYLDVCGLDWYLSKFQRSEGILSGDISPSYSILPIVTIKKIKKLFPSIKIVIVLRHPLERFFSHIKHQHRIREGPFHGIQYELGECSDLFFSSYLAAPQTYAVCDYAGILTRWNSVFDDIHIDFLDLNEDKEILLERIIKYLGGSLGNLSSKIVSERVNATESYSFKPEFLMQVERYLAPHARAVRGIVRSRFGVDVPRSWSKLLQADRKSAVSVPARSLVSSTTIDDRDLIAVLRTETMASSHVQEFFVDHFGFRVINCQGKFFALRGEALSDGILSYSPAEINRLLVSRDMFVASTLNEILMLTKLQKELETQAVALQDKAERIGELEATLERIEGEKSARILELQANLERSQAAFAEELETQVVALQDKVERIGELEATLERIEGEKSALILELQANLERSQAAFAEELARCRSLGNIAKRIKSAFFRLRSRRASAEQPKR